MLSRYYADITGILPSNTRVRLAERPVSTDRLAHQRRHLLLARRVVFRICDTFLGQFGFGPLINPEIPRMVVLGLTLIVIALQVFFSAFLLGVLEIPVKRRANAGRPDAEDPP